MEISNRTPSLLEARNTTYHFDSNVTKASQTPMSAFVNALKLDDKSDHRQSQLNLDLPDALQAMPKQKRAELVAMLKDLQREDNGSEINQILDEKIPDVEKEASGGNAIDRLLDLLFMLISTLGKGQSARNGNAAKFAEMSVKLTEASGQKGINAAQISLGGAIAGMVMSTTTAAIGYGINARGTSNQIDNLKKNARTMDNMKKTNVHVDNEMRHPTSPMTGTSPQERVKVIETRRGPVEVDPCQQNLTPDERAVFEQPQLRSEALIQSKDHAFKISQLEAGRLQAAGSAVTGMTHQVGAVMPAVAATQAAAASAAAKADEAQGQVASSVQRSDEQQAQHGTELLMKIFALIAASSEMNRGTLDAISQGIKV